MIIPALVLHGLLSEVHNRDAVKRAIALLVDRYGAARGGIYLKYPADIEGWHYHDPMGQSALSPARKKRLQRQRWEDGWLRLQLRVDDKLVAALVADGFLDEHQKACRAEVAESLQRALLGAGQLRSRAHAARSIRAVPLLSHVNSARRPLTVPPGH